MIKENFVDLYKRSFENNWDLPGISDYSTGESLYYKDFAREIARIHLLFDKLEIKKGDKIAIIGRNNIQWCATYIATFTYGAIIVPILQDFHPDNVEHIINHSESRFLFSDTNLYKNLRPENMPDLEAVFSLDSFQFNYLYGKKEANSETIISSLDTLMLDKYPEGYQKEHISYAKVDNSELVLINYTSGTTGFSKGVMLSANNLAGNVTHSRYLELLFRGEEIISFLPLAHAYGCAFEFLFALMQGAHVTLLGKAPAPKIIVEAFSKIKPKLVISVPLVLEKIYKSSILPQISKPTVNKLLKVPGVNKLIHRKIRKSLYDALGGNFRQVIIGGAPLNAEVEAFLHKIKFPFTVGYGMTECAPLISYSHHYDFVPTSCGKILDNIMEVRIDSEDPYNVVGEIQVRGENVMMGYYKNEAATKEAFTEDGWLRTGDLGTISKDYRIFIKGRSKTMLLGPNGQNIFPEEIEARLNNLPYIAESLIVQRDSKLVALIFPDLEAMQANNIDADQLADIFENHKSNLNMMLSNYEKISKVVIQDKEFEKTPKKSIKRFLYS